MWTDVSVLWLWKLLAVVMAGCYVVGAYLFWGERRKLQKQVVEAVGLKSKLELGESMNQKLAQEYNLLQAKYDELQGELIDAMQSAADQIRAADEHAESQLRQEYQRQLGTQVAQEIQAASDVTRLVVQYEAEVTQHHAELHALKPPRWVDDEAQSDLARVLAVEAHNQAVTKYQEQVLSIAEKGRQLRAALDDAIITTYKRHGLIEKAMAYEKHAFDVAEKLSYLDPAPGMPDSPLAAKPKQVYEEDPYYEAMHGKPAGRVSTVEGVKP